MTFQRDLAWEGLDAIYRASYSFQLARYALRLKYELLPDRVVHMAKRCLLDGIACNLGGYDAPGRPMCEDVAREMGGPEEATVMGSGMRTSMMNATMVNSFMTRYPECNDSGGGGHNNESIPAVLAVAEREKVDGKEMLTSIVCSYELGARIKESFNPPTGKNPSMSYSGIGNESRGGLQMPPTLGRMMGLNEEQIANAIGCAGTSIILNAIDADREENTMRKNLRLGTMSHHSIMFCMLAKKGFTGPLRIIEGGAGWNEVLAHGGMDFERLVDFSGWRIMDVRTKTYWAGGMLHGHLSATLSLVKDHDLHYEDIEAVEIRVGSYGGKHNTALPKKYPRNSESADHSTHFLTAMMILERAAGHNSAVPSKFTDPKVLDLIERTTVIVDPKIPERSRGGISKITTKDGSVLRAEVSTPHGYDEESPMSDKELEDKLRDIAGVHMKKDKIERLIDQIWNADKLKDTGDLMKLTVF